MEKLNLNYVEPPGGTWDKPACIRDAAPAMPFPLDALPGPMQHMADAVAKSMTRRRKRASRKQRFGGG